MGLPRDRLIWKSNGTGDDLDAVLVSVSVARAIVPTMTLNAWTSRHFDGLDDAVDRTAKWLRDNGTNYGKRALLLPQKGDLSSPAPALVRYGLGNVGSLRGTQARRGGPVLVLGSEMLDTAIKLADGNALAAIAHIPGEVDGWAAATGAFDLRTGEPTPDVEPSIREAIEAVHDAGYNGYSKSDRSLMTRIDTDLRHIAAVGYSFRFLTSYLVALGANRRTVADLEKIYQPISIADRVSHDSATVRQ